MATTADVKLELIALPDVPIVEPGDDIARVIAEGILRLGLTPRNHDVVVIAQKIVSKAESRIVDLTSVQPSDRATTLAGEIGKDARLVELILAESVRVVRTAPNLLIVRHRLGFVSANAGIDQSNIGSTEETPRALLLPEDPDRSAAQLKARLDARFNVDLAVVINDSFGRAWRYGTVGAALGAAGVPAIVDQRGRRDMFGRMLRATVIGFADEIAACASLVMGQADEKRPVVILRGLSWSAPAAPAAALIRPDAEDLFR